MTAAFPILNQLPTPAALFNWLCSVNGGSIDKARKSILDTAALAHTGPERDLLSGLADALALEAHGYGYTEADAIRMDDLQSQIESNAAELCRRLDACANRWSD